MPILPPSSVAPYDTTETVLNFARVIANDCALSLAGDLLSDSQPYTYTMLNIAWRKLQAKLGNNAIENFPQEAIIVGLTAMPQPAVADLGSQAQLGFSGYFDGVNTAATPILPDDLEIPIKLWERPTAQPGAPFILMNMARGGLPSVPKQGRLYSWEWRDDSIYFVGASQSVDLRVRYIRLLDDAANSPTATIPLIRCAVALAYLVVEILAESRGSTIAAKFTTEKDEAIKQIINTTTRKNQRVVFRKRSYSGRRDR